MFEIAKRTKNKIINLPILITIWINIWLVIGWANKGVQSITNPINQKFHTAGYKLAKGHVQPLLVTSGFNSQDDEVEILILIPQWVKSEGYDNLLYRLWFILWRQKKMGGENANLAALQLHKTQTNCPLEKQRLQKAAALTLFQNCPHPWLGSQTVHVLMSQFI